MDILDTVAAISTPFGVGGVAMIRISGAAALDIASKIFVPAKISAFGLAEPNYAYWGRIMSDGEQIDDGIGIYFKAPASFTGEDTVEITCHGGILVTQRVYEAALTAGARPARAGEFTRRAYINGKMKLSGAEALGDLLRAQTNEQIKLARSGMRGVLSAECDEIYDLICGVLASVFAKIDYPDEDLADLSADEMLSAVDKIISRLNKLCDTYRTGRAVAEGIPTVIAGRTNAGKSSLYNRLLGREAAIVTDIEGTTRDILTDTVMLGRVMLRLSDTAGLRETGDIVEQIGVQRAKESLDLAQLVLAVFDGSAQPTDEDREIAEYIKSLEGVKVAIINKSDKGVCPDIDGLLCDFDLKLNISAKTGEGTERLTQMIEEIFIDKSLDTGADAIISNSRQFAAAKGALDALISAKEHILYNSPLEVCCSELEYAMEQIGSLDGRVVREDVVAKIFSSFCVGK